MTIDDAIRHCEEVADGCSGAECKADHRQLAEWLMELKERREQFAEVSKKDTISRQAAIDAAIEAVARWDGMYPQDANVRIRDSINRLPSAQPKRGTWEKVKGIEGAYDFRCSACHRFRFHNGEYLKKYNFCPSCGADMRGGQDEVN